MKRSIVLALLLVGGVLCLAEPVSAQFYPGYGYGAFGGFDGGAALAGSDYRQGAIIDAKSQSRLAGQQAAQQQNLVVQSGIRNTLTNQANSREAAIASQQAQTQDWWFQHQQQQFAQQQMAPRQMAAGQSAEYSMAAAPRPVGAAWARRTGRRRPIWTLFSGRRCCRIPVLLPSGRTSKLLTATPRRRSLVRPTRTNTNKWRPPSKT